MAVVGSLSILVELAGGQDVLKQLQDIKSQGDNIGKQSVTLKFDDTLLRQGSTVIDTVAQKVKDLQGNLNLQFKADGGDIDRIRGNIDKLLIKLKELGAQSNIKLNIDATGGNLEKQITDAEKTAKQAELNQEREAKAYEDRVNRQAAAMQRGIDAFNREQKAQQDALEKEIAEGERAAKAAEQQQAREAKAYDDRVRTQAAAMQRGLNQFNQDQQASADAKIQGMQTLLGGISSGLTKLGGGWQAALDGIEKFSNGMVHAGQVAATFAYRMTILTAAIDVLGAKSIQFGTEFESNMAKVGTQLDGTEQQVTSFVEKSGDAILKMSQQFPTAANDLSKSLYFIVSSTNLTGDQALAALKPIAELATVGKTSAEELSKGVATAFSVFHDQLARFGDDTQQAQHIVEVFWEAVRKGKVEVSDVAPSFSRLAQFVKEAGGSFEDSMASWSILSRAFTAPQAATALENLGKAMTKPAAEAKAAWQELGITLSDEQGNIRPMFDVLGELFNKLQGMKPDAARDILGAIFPNIRGEQAALFFQNVQNWKDMLALRDQMIQGSPNFNQALQEMMNTTDTLFKMVSNNFDVLSAKIFANFEPTLRGALTGIISILQAIGNNQAAVSVVSQIGAAIAVAAPAALILGTALMGAGGLVSAIATLMTPAYLIGFGMIWETIAPAIHAAAESVNAFGGGLKGIVATITEVARQLGVISNADAKSIFDQLGVVSNPQAVQSVKDFVSQLRILGDDAAKIGDAIKTVAEGIGQLVQNISEGKGALGFIATIFKDIAGSAVGNISFSASGVADILDKVIAGTIAASVGGAILGALAKIGTMFVTAGVVNIAAGGTPGNVLSGASGGLGGLFGGIGGGSAIAGFGVALTATIGAALERYFLDNASKSKIPFFGNAALGLDTGNPLFGVAGGLADAISNALTGKNYIDAVAAGVQQGMNNAGKQGGGLNQGLKDAAHEFVASQPTLPALGGSAGSSLDLGVAGEAGSELKSLSTSAVSASVAIGNLGLAASGAAGAISANPNLGGGYMVAPTPSVNPDARSYGLDALLQARYPDLMKGEAANWETTIGKPMTEAGKAADKFASAAQAAAEKLKSAFEGIVKDALSPTNVTPDDQKRMDLEKKMSKLQGHLDSTEGKPNQRRNLESQISDVQKELDKLGAYKDQPDEFARRERAVGTGTDPGKYGAQFAEQRALAQKYMPGANDQQIANAFEDRSLFAAMKPEEIDKMFNWDAVVANVKAGIARVVGEFRLMKEAVKNVLKDLDPATLASFKEAMGAPSNATLDDIASKYTGMTMGLDSGKGGTDNGISPKVDPKALADVKTLSGYIDNLRKEILVKVGFDEGAWKTVTGKIDDVEKYIKEHLLKYADVFIQITATASINSDNGGAGQSGGAAGAQNNARNNGVRAGGGYVGTGTYTVGEQGYEYVLPNKLTQWMEKILGGRIQDPREIEWLITALARGKTEALNQLQLWAGGMTGSEATLPKKMSEWLDAIMVSDKTGKSLNYADWLWSIGTTSGANSPKGSGGGGGSSGSGSGGGIDFSAFNSAVSKFASAVDVFVSGVGRNPIGGGQLRLLGAGGGAGMGGGGVYGSAAQGGIHFHGDVHITAPNGATLEGLERQIRARAAHGYE